MSDKNLLNSNMRLTYYLFLVLMSLFLSLSAAVAGNGKVPLSWYALPEDYPDKTMDEFDWEDPDDDLKDEVDDIYEAQGDSYDELLRESHLAGKSSNAWELWTIRSQLGISAGGSIGVLALKGGIAAEIRWYKKSYEKDLYETEEAPSDAPAHASFNVLTPEAEIERTLEKIANTAYRAGRIESKTLMLQGMRDAIRYTKSMVHAAPDTSRYAWSPYRFRLKINFAASGKPVPFVEVGGDVQIRFDWEIPPYYKSDAPDMVRTPREEIAAQSFREVIRSFSDDMGVFVQREPLGGDWGVKNFQIIIGQTASGTVGLAKVSGTVSGRVYFKRNSPMNKSATVYLSPLNENSRFNLIRHDPDQKLQKYAKRKGISYKLDKLNASHSDSIFRIDRNQFRRGLIKAEKIATFFIKRAQKNRQDYWKLKEARTDFKLSLGGSIGVTTLTAYGEIRVEYADKNW